MANRWVSDPLVHQMAESYARQRLVPFLGAGMSVPRCVTWEAFVGALEKRAGIVRDPSRADLTERANSALASLRRREVADLRDALRAALLPDAPDSSIPRQTEALARLDWPLVLTTNYDDLYKASKTPTPAVLGRSALDCQRILTSLQEPGEPLLWALHGFLGGIAGEAPLADRRRPVDLVVGHDEYRKVIHTEVHFRRAFAEVLRTRSLLFLGCGLDDPHLVGLFEETLALTGRPPFPHYAVLFEENGSADRQWALHSRLALTPVVLPRFRDLPTLLDALANRAASPRPQVSRWTVAFPQVGAEPEDGPLLEILRGRLPDSIPSDSCLAVSAGRGDDATRGVRPFFSSSIRGLLNRLGIDERALSGMETGEAMLVRGHDVIVAFARSSDRGKRGRDARLISTATEAMLDLASEQGFRTVKSQLLAAGRGAPFPGRVALAQMLRGYSRWHARHPKEHLDLQIHVVDPQLLAELSANRIDLLEMLDVNTSRFWTEVAEGTATSSRDLHFLPPSTTLNELAAGLYTDRGGWRAVVYPSPTYEECWFRLPEEGTASMDDIGVLPGSTVRFSLRDDDEESTSGDAREDTRRVVPARRRVPRSR